MVREVGGPPPVPFNNSPNQDNPIVNGDMAGYIDDITALIGTKGWSLFASYFKGEIGANDPTFQFALGPLMEIMGNPEFGAALTNEMNAEKPGSLCQQFQTLYKELTTQLLPGGDTRTLLSVCQDYYSNPSNRGNDTTTLTWAFSQQSDPLTSFFAQFQNSDAFSGCVSSYDKVKDAPDLNRLMNALSNFMKYWKPNDGMNAFNALNGILNIWNNNPAAQNDPNFQLAMLLLDSPAFNTNSDGTIPDSSGNPMKDVNGNVIHCHSLLDFVRFWEQGTAPSDKTTFWKDIDGFLKNPVSGSGSGSQTWMQLISQLSNLFH